MSTNRSTSRIALALIAGLALTGTALAQRGADRAAHARQAYQMNPTARHMRLALNTPTTYNTTAFASQATSTYKSNSSANAAKRANPTVSWSFAPSANLYTGGA